MTRIVAIVGRPNVGKSTLFNRMVGERKAIVDDFSGVTRDRHYGVAEWTGQEFTLIDTGGFVADSEDVFEKEINHQVKIAVEEAAVILFMVDVITGITPLDESMADLLRRSKKPVLVIVNKVDSSEKMNEIHEFYSLGFDQLFPMASASGSGTGEVLDEVVKLLPPAPEEKEEHNLPRIAIVGRPNVGKSSLVNALLGDNRNIVTDVAGTTRDSIDTIYKAYNNEFVLIDTAGIRKKGKVHEDIEFYSVMRSLRTLENADVVVLIIDAQLGVDAQDVNLFYLANRNNKGVVVLVNKWDLIAEKETNTAKEYEKMVKEKLEPFTDVPVLFISALTKQRVHKAVETIMEVYNNRKKRITTSKLNDFLQEIVDHYPPPAIKGKFVKIKYATQLPGNYPAFAFFCNLPQYIKEPYKRYMENKLREKFDFKGVSLKLFFRKK